jgi:glycosyltransferase involved in cell wall biosynthesis
VTHFGRKAKTVLYVVNDAAFFVSHRLPLALAAKACGYDVVVATGGGEGVEDIRRAGLEHRSIPLERSGTNPLTELRLVLAIARLYRQVKPDIVHLVTIKPVLYGGILSRMLRVPAAVFAISGMGYLFGKGNSGLVHGFARFMYRLALGHRNSRVIVQNEADRHQLKVMGALRTGQDVLIPGSGVDLVEYSSAPLPKDRAIVILPARMLWEKGVGEFVQAARLVRAGGVECRFALVGPYDGSNPSAVSREDLEAWNGEGVVEWWGRRSDMPEVYRQATLVVLPSFYREGVPKALLEAAASGRPIVTTDAPGCRDVVDDYVTGRLVPPRDEKALANTILELLSDPDSLDEMGRMGRLKAEREFGVEKVIQRHMEIYMALQPPPGGQVQGRSAQ